MQRRLPIIIGLIATAFAIVFNLAPAATPEADLALGIAALVMAVVAGACGIWALRRGRRLMAVAMIGPAVFVLAESVMRLLLAFSHGK